MIWHPLNTWYLRGHLLHKNIDNGNSKRWEQTITFNPVISFFLFFFCGSCSSPFFALLAVLSLTPFTLTLRHSILPPLLPCPCSTGWEKRAERTTSLPSSGRRTETGRNSSTLSSSNCATLLHSTTPSTGTWFAGGPKAATQWDCLAHPMVAELGDGWCF